MLRPGLFALFALAAVVVGAQSSPQVVVPRVGSLAADLTADDMAQIRRVASRYGGQVWVVFADRGVWITGTWAVAAFMQPSVVSGSVRTGVIVWAQAEIKGPLAKRTWTASDPGDAYAQVVMPGRAPDAIESVTDLNRPFRLVGTWETQEIADLVAFIRSSPASSNTAKRLSGSLPRVNGVLPILALMRSSNGTIEVRMREEERTHHSVQITRQGTGWVVTSILMLSVD